MALRAQIRDSSSEATETNPHHQAIEKEILDAVAELEEDIMSVPILDPSMLDYGNDL
jgi:hypothetical protein